MSVTHAPRKTTTFVYVLVEQANDTTGPQERLMHFCNYFRNSAQEKLEITVIAQQQQNMKTRAGPGIPIQHGLNSDQKRCKKKNHRCLADL